MKLSPFSLSVCTVFPIQRTYFNTISSVMENQPLIRTSDLPPPIPVTNYGTANVETSKFHDKPKRQNYFIPVVLLLALGSVFVVFLFTTSLFPIYISPTSSAYLRQNTPQTDHLDIDTPQGRIRGFTKTSRQGRDYTAFYKVPYAEPPLNSLRFKDPISPKIPSWSGLREISTVAPQCIQKESSDRAAGEEDCLYANIYVPNISENISNQLLPVMVYIHGGGFTDGNGSRYGADYFMDEDVILITFQFRLGPFGFLNTEDDVIHGNMGFKDQVQMLVWVRDNIKYYGGDNSRVTIFGHSSGGSGVGYLTLSPMAKGLFHRAISQSGTDISSTDFPDPLKIVKEFGEVLNCSTESSSLFLDCLRTKDAAEITLAKASQSDLGLTIEKRNDNQVFMPDTPYHLLKSQASSIPCIIGVVNAETVPMGVVVVNNEQFVKSFNDNFTSIGNDFLDVDFSSEELNTVREFYFGTGDITNSSFREMTNMLTDRQYAHCAYTSANLHSKFGPTYLYFISKPPPKSYAKRIAPDFPSKELGMVSHTDELQYLFLYDGYPEITSSQGDYFQYSTYLVKMWATFATTGIPNVRNNEWKPVDSFLNGTTFWFDLNDKPGRSDFFQERMLFWDQFAPKQLKYSS